MSRRRNLFVLPGLFVMAGLLALWIDCPLAVWCRDADPHRDLVKPLEVAEPFGHGVGVLLIVLTIYLLDPLRRRALVRVLACSFGSGLAANLVKMLVARSRPRQFDLEGSVWETFGGLFPLLDGGSGNQSLPSAHTATAVGLAFALAWLYPRGRWLFATLAVLVACQRIQSSAHFLSDTLFGAALGCAVAAVCLQTGPLARRFDRWESGCGSGEH